MDTLLDTINRLKKEFPETNVSFMTSNTDKNQAKIHQIFWNGLKFNEATKIGSYLVYTCDENFGSGGSSFTYNRSTSQMVFAYRPTNSNELEQQLEESYLIDSNN